MDQELIFSKVVGDDDINSQLAMLRAGKKKIKKPASSFSIVSLNSEVYFEDDFEVSGAHVYMYSK